MHQTIRHGRRLNVASSAYHACPSPIVNVRSGNQQHPTNWYRSAICAYPNAESGTLKLHPALERIELAQHIVHISIICAYAIVIGLPPTSLSVKYARLSGKTSLRPLCVILNPSYWIKTAFPALREDSAVTKCVSRRVKQTKRSIQGLAVQSAESP